MEHRCSENKLVRPCSIWISSSSSAAQTGTISLAMQLPPHSGSPRMAGHALVLGSGTTFNRIHSSCLHLQLYSNNEASGVLQQPAVSQPSCLVSRGEQLQEQGFSSEVAERIAAPQRPSTRAIYKSKWAFF